MAARPARTPSSTPVRLPKPLNHHCPHTVGNYQVQRQQLARQAAVGQAAAVRASRHCTTDALVDEPGERGLQRGPGRCGGFSGGESQAKPVRHMWDIIFLGVWAWGVGEAVDKLMLCDETHQRPPRWG